MTDKSIKNTKVLATARIKRSEPISDSGIYEYDPYEKNLRRLSGAEDGLCELGGVAYNVPESLIKNGLVHPRSIEDIRNLFMLLDGGEPYVESEIVFVKADDDSLWRRFTCVGVFDDEGYLQKAVIICKDVTSEKNDALEAERERRGLMDEINKDPLTGLLNIRHMQEKVVAYLNKLTLGKEAAMFMIDVDNYQAINYHMGHQQGDEFLKAVGDKLRSVFRRETDWICRMRADEYLVFADECDEIAASKLAIKLCEAAGQLGAEFVESVDFPHDLGVSVGIAICGLEKVDFEELYRHADKALFAAKSKGKNGFVVYGNI